MNWRAHGVYIFLLSATITGSLFVVQWVKQAHADRFANLVINFHGEVEEVYLERNKLDKAWALHQVIRMSDEVMPGLDSTSAKLSPLLFICNARLAKLSLQDGSTDGAKKHAEVALLYSQLGQAGQTPTWRDVVSFIERFDLKASQ